MKKLCFVLPLLLFLHPAVAAPLDDGISAYMAGHYAKAFQTLQPLARSGNSDAQYYVGGMFAEGLGTAPDSDKALLWLNKAVANNHREAATFLGKMYLSGRGVPLDLKKGAYYMTLSAELEPEDEPDVECDSE